MFPTFFDNKLFLNMKKMKIISLVFFLVIIFNVIDISLQTDNGSSSNQDESSHRAIVPSRGSSPGRFIVRHSLYFKHSNHGYLQLPEGSKIVRKCKFNDQYLMKVGSEFSSLSQLSYDAVINDENEIVGVFPGEHIFELGTIYRSTTGGPRLKVGLISGESKIMQLPEKGLYIEGECYEKPYRLYIKQTQRMLGGSRDP